MLPPSYHNICYNVNVELIEYKQHGDSQHWYARKIRSAFVLDSKKNSQGQYTELTLGLTKSWRARVAKWRNINDWLYSRFGEQILKNSSYGHALRVGSLYDDNAQYYNVVVTFEQIKYRRKKTVYILKLMTTETVNILDYVLLEQG